MREKKSSEPDTKTRLKMLVINPRYVGKSTNKGHSINNSSKIGFKIADPEQMLKVHGHKDNPMY